MTGTRTEIIKWESASNTSRAYGHREIARPVAAPDLKQKMAAIGYEPAAVPSVEFAARIKADMSKWAKLISDAKIRPQ